MSPAATSSRALVIAAVLGVSAVCVWWFCWGAMPERVEYPSAPPAPPPSANAGAGDTAVPPPHGALAGIPPAALAATLWDEPPAAAAQPEAPPPLAMELVAVVGRAGDRRAFVFDAAGNAYHELRAGEEVPGRKARLLAIDERGAVIEHLGREVRLEIKP